MEFNKQKFSLAAGVTAAVAYGVCAFVVVLWPEAALRLLGWVAHLVNVEKFAGDVTISFGSFLIGLFQILVYAYAAAFVFAWLYNKFIQPRS
ncbi:MAG: hypothetical protein A3I24_02065 [Candidatus Harrisonbacteria bacterium RIFCSPLOWO2_02_FULL_41_13b]|uniref:Uncharacterized protein n=1 Tax=Candidatus Harrisonbacteria bacterium RIFCSPLOWO2_02_FULL_41_13b TaxID=1798409 RepID=A0A1G1ZW11_9BACT|nr:MAG: hypothetical protein A3J53_03445 [Candidatus Harrisonbacteria bacterium RIFCSPHIGHO2_02_FULL_40_20]OGY67930.1 MAG: hypothetical protein A3I24_02065 [Candidatus Harrisonbacteria bacterium RIFCSPLOWO2_02_FULL_41_13b]